MYEYNLESDVEEFFDSALTTGHVMDILQDYSHSVMDLSLNEVTVHSVPHSKVQVEKPYLKLESKFLKQTSLIYQQINPVVHGKELFEQFFSLDCRIVSQLFLNRTFSRFFNCAIERQIGLIDDYLIGGPSLSSSSTRNGVELKTPITRVRGKAGLSFDGIDKILNMSTEKDSDISSPDNCLRLFRESILQKVLTEEIPSEDDQLEDKIKKSSSCTSRKRTSDNLMAVPSFMKRNKSKTSLTKQESERKPLPGHDPEQFQIFNELRSLLVI